jgi:hypothetical protein
MKRTVLLLALLALIVPGLAVAQAPAPTRPGPEHKKLAIWIGDWTYEGEIFATPLGPAGKTQGKASVRSALGGFFVEWRGEDAGAWGAMQWLELDGYDAAQKRYTWDLFGSDGAGQRVHYTIEGTTVAYSGTQRAGNKEVRIRGTVVFAADLMSNVDKREMSLDGATWVPLWETKSIKSRAAVK